MNHTKKGTLTVHFSIGFGNNIFQYVFSRLVAEKNNLFLCSPGIPELGINPTETVIDQSLPFIHIGNEGYKTGVYDKHLKADYSNHNVIVKGGFFEDYTLYQPYLEKIRNWFTHSSYKRNTSDLVIHFRLQNRLVMVNHYLNFIEPFEYKNVIDRFSFDKLHIVTDAEKWDYHNENDIKRIRKDIMKGPNPAAHKIKTYESIDYMNSLVDVLSEYNPVIHTSQEGTIPGSGALRGGFIDAFDYIRSFDKGILYNSTFSWWGLVLGGAKEVGVFSQWKPGREDNQPNLGETSYPGWFRWGKSESLIANRPKVQKYARLSWSKRTFWPRKINKAIKAFRALKKIKLFGKS